MHAPISLDDWSLVLVHQLVASPDGEPAWFDFKEALNARDPQWNAKLSKAACAMANTGGGFLVFGVLDQVPQGGTPHDRIKGIPISGEERHDFGQKVARIQTSIGFDMKTLLLPSGDGIAVFHIPESPLRPHMFEGVFYRSGDAGEAVSMSFYEVREQMLGGEERRRNVLLLMAKLAQYYRLAEQLEKSAQGAHIFFDRFDIIFFDNLLVGAWGILPHDWLVQRLMRVMASAYNRIASAC
jgi:hypothetical protein